MLDLKRLEFIDVKAAAKMIILFYLKAETDHI